MQVIEVHSGQDLSTRAPQARHAGSYSYKLHSRQFDQEYRRWRNSAADREPTLGLMTLSADRIWMTQKELEQVADAIRDLRSPITLV